MWSKCSRCSKRTNSGNVAQYSHSPHGNGTMAVSRFTQSFTVRLDAHAAFYVQGKKSPGLLLALDNLAVSASTSFLLFWTEEALEPAVTALFAFVGCEAASAAIFSEPNNKIKPDAAIAALLMLFMRKILLSLFTGVCCRQTMPQTPPVGHLYSSLTYSCGPIRAPPAPFAAAPPAPRPLTAYYR